jgi:hypothetical protein
MSLGKRASILAQLQEIVPQFTYADGDQTGSAEIMPLSPSAVGTPHEVPPLADMLRSPIELGR